MFVLFVTACADRREVNGCWLQSGKCPIELPPSSRLLRSHRLRDAEPPEIETLARPAQNADVFPMPLSFPSLSSLDVIGISLTFAAPLDKHCPFRRLVALQGRGIYPTISMAEATSGLGAAGGNRFLMFMVGHIMAQDEGVRTASVEIAPGTWRARMACGYR